MLRVSCHVPILRPVVKNYLSGVLAVSDISVQRSIIEDKIQEGEEGDSASRDPRGSLPRGQSRFVCIFASMRTFKRSDVAVLSESYRSMCSAFIFAYTSTPETTR